MKVYNTGNKKIFITVEYEPDPNGCPATPISQMYVGPGQGIDLDILDLHPKREDIVNEFLRQLKEFYQLEK